jgi:hypothetical protein
MNSETKDKDKKTPPTSNLAIAVVAAVILVFSVSISLYFAKNNPTAESSITATPAKTNTVIVVNPNSNLVGSYQGLGWIATNTIRFGSITCVLTENGQINLKTGKYDLSTTKNDKLKVDDRFPSFSMEIQGKYTVVGDVMTINIEQKNYLLLIDDASVSKDQASKVLAQMQAAGLNFSGLDTLPKSTKLNFVINNRGLDLKPIADSVVGIEFQGRKV